MEQVKFLQWEKISIVRFILVSPAKPIHARGDTLPSLRTETSFSLARLLKINYKRGQQLLRTINTGTLLLMKMHKPMEILHWKPTFWCSATPSKTTWPNEAAWRKFSINFLFPILKLQRSGLVRCLHLSFLHWAPKWTQLPWTQSELTSLFSGKHRSPPRPVSKARLLSASSQDSLSRMKNINQKTGT